MKVTLLTANMQKALSLLNHAVSQKNQLPILSTILLEATTEDIVLRSTDLEIGIETHVTATVESEGSMCIPAKPFTELVNSLSDESITLEAKEQSLHVQSKRTKSVFQIMSKDEFPSLYEEKGEKIATLEGKDITKGLQPVIFAASQDTSRPALSGILMKRTDDGFLLVATDGYRLSLKQYTIAGVTSEEQQYVIPARFFRELAMLKDDLKTIELYVASGSNQILFAQGGTVIVGRLIEADFPPYEKIIPSDFSVRVTFEREELQQAVKICSIFAKDAANIIKLSLKKDHIVVSSQSVSVGENTVNVEAQLHGEENEIAFNARYLHDVLGNIDAKEITFDMMGPLNPGVFRVANDESFLHLIMPIRVQG